MKHGKIKRLVSFTSDNLPCGSGKIPNTAQFEHPIRVRDDRFKHRENLPIETGVLVKVRGHFNSSTSKAKGVMRAKGACNSGRGTGRLGRSHKRARRRKIRADLQEEVVMRRWMVSVLVGAVACTAVAAGSASAATNAGLRPGPIEGKQRVHRHQFYSTNWSGYTAHEATFTSVSGSWVQPAIHCDGIKGQRETVATFFIGLDGFDSGTVEQTGVDAICVGNTKYYVPWYEFYPDRAVFFFDDAVNPTTDTLTATVTQNGTDVTTTLEDNHQSWHITASEPVDSLAFNSAEWIVESPAHALSNFDHVTFSSASATDTAHHTGPINDDAWSNEEIIMVKGHKIISDPGPLTNGGHSFDVHWLGM